MLQPIVIISKRALPFSDSCGAVGGFKGIRQFMHVNSTVDESALHTPDFCTGCGCTMGSETTGGFTTGGFISGGGVTTTGGKGSKVMGGFGVGKITIGSGSTGTDGSAAKDLGDSATLLN